MTYDLIETHFHPDPDDNFEGELEIARADGVGGFIAVGANLESSRVVGALADRIEDLWCTAGLHPHEAAQFDGDVEPYRELLASAKACAVGEIGLDYYYEHSDRVSQGRVFRTFLKLAAELQLPAVIHCRDAYDDCLDILRETLAPGQPFEIHSFTGPLEVVREFLDMGAYISFNGIVTFKKAENVRQALDAVPLDRLLLETDAPYLAPVPHRGHHNCPAYLTHIAKYIAKRKGMMLSELAQQTTTNARSFFRL